MPLARNHHVLIAIAPDAHFASCLCRRQRRQSCEDRGLRFFSAETAAHPQALHDDTVHRNCEQMRDDVLHFGWMLRR